MFILISIVIAIAANKSDLFEKEQVPENEARNFACEIGAFFQYTNLCNDEGIEELFKDIGCQFLDPNYKEKEEEKRKWELIENQKFPETQKNYKTKFDILLKWAKY